MKIVIATGIYPPEIGGPSEYARQLLHAFHVEEAHVVVFGKLKRFPTGIRHLLYFFKLLFSSLSSDYIIALDTFSVAFPAVGFARLFRKKIAIRVAGDFLWESYVERVREPILLSKFYDTKRTYTLKERIIFLLTRFSLRHSDAVVFSTDWQKKIWEKPYRLKENKTWIIENFFPAVEKSNQAASSQKVLLFPSRERYIKNKAKVEEAFREVSKTHPEIASDTSIVSREALMEKIRNSYAVIVASISEVSPNLVLDSIGHGIPAIVTEDMGIADRLRGMVVFVNPLSKEDIKSAIEQLLNPDIYESYRRRMLQSTYTHSWNEIAREFIDIYERIENRR